LKELEGGDIVASAAHVGKVRLADFTEEIDDGLDEGFGAFELRLLLEVILVTALDPVGEVLGIEAFAGVTQFIDDDPSGQAIIEHAVEHVAGGFWEPGNFAITAEVLGFGLGVGEFGGQEVDFGTGDSSGGHGGEG
ncbi:MAG: hypothetical protein ACREP9_11400, partial [Candidatus Dormibacteraceae bacterium]